ncbi:hypothetical protein AB4Z17_11685 [Paenibacillus sp. TAF43_2]|uniref:hypothetical protein n=1 Tax=Paenibacillus sp. TAF43_2 TaxID=3233069 RepID=UPI003F9C3236
MIEQIKEALEKATPGPWKYQKGFYGSNHLVYEIDTDILICTAKTHAKTEENMQLIAQFPTYIRYLLDELEKERRGKEVALSSHKYLEGELEKANKEIEKVTLERDNEYWRAVWYEGHIEDASRSADKWQQHFRELLEEHKTIKEALKKVGYYLKREAYIPAEILIENFLPTLNKEAPTDG